MHRIKVNEHFDLEQIMTCGQAFRYKPLAGGAYEVIAYGKRLRLGQTGTDLALDCSEMDYDHIWQHYFDMSSDYGAMKGDLIEADPRMAAYIARKPGIRILNQEPFEMVITFILSQNKSMPQIMQLVGRLSETYGKKRTDAYGDYYEFPTPEALKEVSEETYRSLKVGFRAPYLVDAVRKINDGLLDLTKLEGMRTDEARESLLQVKGIGGKVADCVLLFGYHRLDVFPLDVWMKRAVSNLYYDGDKVSDKKMLAKAHEVYGDLAGLAQQYIFFGMVAGD